MAAASPIFLCIFFLGIISVGSQNTVCPFDYLYHFGDGATDVGNSVLIKPWGPLLPPSRLPYGRTFPGRPNGRWSDGLIDFDFAAFDFGFPEIVPYLSPSSNSSNGVIFSVARSPVLDSAFFAERGVKIPPYAVSLKTQLDWFKDHLLSVCNSSTDCVRSRLENALVLLGDLEANDIGYALTQGKTVEQLGSYIVPITDAQIDTVKELINMGSKIVVVPASAPLGCFPYILTALQTDDAAAYDNLGCLSSVNQLIDQKNNYLEQALNNLTREFPGVTIIYGAFDEGVLAILAEAMNSESRADTALVACCGIGGKYNYTAERFCASPGVPVCENPAEHIFWDGIHFTQEASSRIEQSLIEPTLVALNCTLPSRAFAL